MSKQQHGAEAAAAEPAVKVVVDSKGRVFANGAALLAAKGYIHLPVVKIDDATPPSEAEKVFLKRLAQTFGNGEAIRTYLLKALGDKVGMPVPARVTRRSDPATMLYEL